MTLSFIIKESQKATTSTEIVLKMIDGPVYTLVPGGILSNSGVEPYREMIFEIWTEDEENELDGKMIEIRRKVGEAYFEYNGAGAMSPVVFGEENDEPTIGEATLAALGLQLNYSENTLEPLSCMLL